MNGSSSEAQFRSSYGCMAWKWSAMWGLPCWIFDGPIGRDLFCARNYEEAAQCFCRRVTDMHEVINYSFPEEWNLKRKNKRYMQSSL